MKVPFLITGALIGIVVGFMFMPAENRIGLPAEYVMIPVCGAIVGSVLGAVLERIVNRETKANPNARPMRRLGEKPRDADD